MITEEAQLALGLMVVRAEIVLKQFEAHNDQRLIRPVDLKKLRAAVDKWIGLDNVEG